MSQTLPAPKRHDRPATRAVVRYRTVDAGGITTPLTYRQGAYRLIFQQQIQPKEEDEEVYE